MHPTITGLSYPPGTCIIAVCTGIITGTALLSTTGLLSSTILTYITITVTTAGQAPGTTNVKQVEKPRYADLKATTTVPAGQQELVVIR